MKRSDSLDLSIREAKSRLNALAGQDSLSDEETTECGDLEGKLQVAETQYRAAKLSEASESRAAEELDGESRELAQLTERANVGDILSATFEKRQTSGEAAELQKHYGIGSHQIPLEMLRIDRGVEERAAATVPASIGDASQAGVITPVFASGDGAFLGIERPVVPVGDSSFPLLSTVPSVKGPFTGSDNAAQTDATFVANNLSS